VAGRRHGRAAGAVVYRGGVVMRCPLFVELCAGVSVSAWLRALVDRELDGGEG
jgi:hypothetical protein